MPLAITKEERKSIPVTLLQDDTSIVIRTATILQSKQTVSASQIDHLTTALGWYGEGLKKLLERDLIFRVAVEGKGREDLKLMESEGAREEFTRIDRAWLEALHKRKEEEERLI